MRPWLVSEIATKLLGPTQGPNEKIFQRPDLIYSLGILAPKKKQGHPEDIQAELIIENGAEMSGEGVVEGEEAPPAPWIDPTAKPSSMGLSFTCATDDEIPKFGICITYARYQYDESDESFLRIPRACILPWETLESVITSGNRTSKAIVWLSPKDVSQEQLELVVCSKEKAEIGLNLTIRSGFMNTDLFSITCLIHSRIPPRAEDGKYDANMNSQLNIHQPEIRIALESGTTLREYSPETSTSTEDEIDSALYHGRGQKARGHLCSAVWKQFDPQHIATETRDTMNIILGNGEEIHYGKAPPFAWVDHSVAPLKDRGLDFYPPDARTEYLPMLNIAAPKMNPKWKEGESILSAQKLSEATKPAAVEAILSPLLNGYKDWINDSFDVAAYPHHSILKIQAEDAHERMKKRSSFIDE